MMSLSKNVDAILITGPTASGKSMFAMQLALKYSGEIINADSMQVYNTLQTLTSRPSLEEMKNVPHHLYGHVSVKYSYSTGEWLRCATKAITDIRKRGRLPIIVGGTGLYFRALTGRFSEMPFIPDIIRKNVRERLRIYGPERLYAELKAVDSLAAQGIRSRDGQRIVRALEVFTASGQSITQFWQQSIQTPISDLCTLRIVIWSERDELQRNIHKRFKQMLDGGAIDEVQQLMKLELPSKLPAMKAIGVRDIMLMLRGEISCDQVLQRGIIATRQYAKRQTTWFRYQLDESWQRISSPKEFMQVQMSQ